MAWNFKLKTFQHFEQMVEVFSARSTSSAPLCALGSHVLTIGTAAAQRGRAQLASRAPHSPAQDRRALRIARCLVPLNQRFPFGKLRPAVPRGGCPAYGKRQLVALAGPAIGPSFSWSAPSFATIRKLKRYARPQSARPIRSFRRPICAASARTSLAGAD